jgi:hypothetical protein
MMRSRTQQTAAVLPRPSAVNAASALIGAALFAAFVLLAMPGAAHASPRESSRSVVTVTTVSHPHGYRSPRHRAYHHEPSHDSRRVNRARRYASQATAQASSAWRMGCGRSGPRWSTSWDDHYFWALSARPRELRRELDRREDHLHGCRAHHRHGARHYRHAWPY